MQMFFIFGHRIPGLGTTRCPTPRPVEGQLKTEFRAQIQGLGQIIARCRDAAPVEGQHTAGVLHAVGCHGIAILWGLAEQHRGRCIGDGCLGWPCAGRRLQYTTQPSFCCIHNITCCKQALSTAHGSHTVLRHAHLQASGKPEGDKYSFTHFAHKLMSSEGVNPLPSDSRRRKDRYALEARAPAARKR